MRPPRMRMVWNVDCARPCMGGEPLTSPAGRGSCTVVRGGRVVSVVVESGRARGAFVSDLSLRGPPANGVGRGQSHSHSQSTRRARAHQVPRGAKCVQGQWRAGADFACVRFALGLSAGRPTHGTRRAARWGIWWCACGWCARGSAGAGVCQVLRWPVWPSCAVSVQPGHVCWARLV